MRTEIKTKLIILTAVLALFTMPLPVLAQDLPEDRTESLEKETLPAGLYPALTATWKSDDNILKLDAQKLSDNIYSLRPSLTLMSLFRKHSFEASYFVDIIRFQDSSDENFEDHYIDAQLNLDLTKRLKMRFVGDYATAHELRGGSGTRITLSDEPDAWWGDRILGEISYGRRTHKNQIIVSVESYRRRYTNNSQQPRSRNQQNYQLEFFHSFGAKTRMILEGRYSRFVYYDKSAPLDLTSRELALLLGLTWEATAKTTGTIKAGYLSKDLDDEPLPDFEGWSAWVDVNWEIKAYSVISFLASRRTKESPHTVGSFYDSTEFGANWRHDLTERWVLLSKILFQSDKYSRVTDIERDDDLVDFELEITFSLLRWLDVGALYHYSSRKSTYPGIDFKSNTIMIQVAADTM